MPGASISRWTMSYFAASLVFLVLGQALLAASFGFPVQAIEAPQTLIIVHLLAIGWLGLLFCGALLQFVPVLVSRPLYAQALAPYALVSLITGLLLLCCGFLHLAGYFEGSFLLLPLGGASLTIGFALILTMVGGTLAGARPMALPARFVALGLLSLLFTVSIGFAFTLELSGVVDIALLTLLPQGVSVHAYFGLIGWMSVSAFGVSYRLLTMFLLAPEVERRTSHTAFAFVAASLVTAFLVLLSLASGKEIAVAVHFPLALAAAAALLFGLDVLAIFRTRKRKTLEVNALMSAWAVGALVAAVMLYLLLLLTSRLEQEIGALVYLIGFGWLSLLGLGQLYKIVAFITWLEHYGPVLGKKPVPRVQDLVDEHRASQWFCVYGAMVMAAVAALLADEGFLFELAVCGQLLAAIALIAELARTRYLSYVPAGSSQHEARSHPRLFLPRPIERS